MRRVVVIGNPASKRVDLFQQALARRRWPVAEVVPWLDVLADPGRLAPLTSGAFVRLESPGRDFEVEKQLLARGADEPDDEDPDAKRITAATARELPFEKGRILYPRQWYRGFRAVLRELAQLDACWLNHPADVIELFDKRLCQRRLADAGVSIPAPLGPARSYEELLARMRETRKLRVFVKLACGSSGSGVVAFALGRDRVMATTSVELVSRDGRWLMFNSRRIRRYETHEEVAALFDTLCPEGVQVEEWLPKAGFRDGSCDLRVLIVAGQERHAIVRISKTPLTNLHLLNERADVEELRYEVLAEDWDAAIGDCRKAATAYPRCLYVGVDFAFAPGFGRHVVFEANAFGDLLPGLLWHGLDTYEAELAALETHVSMSGS